MCWSLPFIFLRRHTCLFLSTFFVTIACKPRGLRVVACTLRSRLAAALSCGAGNLAVKKRWLRIARREPLQPAFPQLLPAFPACFSLLSPAFPSFSPLPALSPTDGKNREMFRKSVTISGN